MTALSDANATGDEAGTKLFSYDVDGNLTSDGRKGLELSWNVLNLVDSAAMHGSSLKYAWLSDGTLASVKADDGTGGGVRKRYMGSFVYTSDTGNSADEPTEVESIAWDEGRILFDVPYGSEIEELDDPEAIVVDTATVWVDFYRDCWFAGDHLGNVRAVVDITEDLASPQVLEQNDYLPFGTKVQDPDLTCWMDNRWQYAGKEAQRFAPGGVFNQPSLSGSGSVDLGLLNFGARMYDPFTARWTAVDPMARKYASFSPYIYCLGNPICIFDPNGDTISFLHWQKDDNMTIGGLWINGASEVTRNAVENFAKTEDGFKLLSRFAKAGDRIGSVSFSSDGDLSDYELNFKEYSSNNGVAGSFNITIKDSSPQFNVLLNISYGDEVDNTLTIGHEVFIHMDKAYEKIARAHYAAGIMENPSLFFNAVDNYRMIDEKVDHSNYLNHVQSSRFSIFVNQLMKVFDPNSVSKAKVRHDHTLQK